MDVSAFSKITGMFPPEIARRFEPAVERVGREAVEIRVRAGKPCAVVTPRETVFVVDADGPVVVGQREVQLLLAHLCEFSLYKNEVSLARGYVTIRGGHRVGVCASFLQGGGIDIGSVSSINIRIARQHKGCAQELLAQVMRDRPQSVLLAGPPLCGKTTLLRDLARLLANPPHCLKTVVIDERGELCGVWNGRPMLDTGACSDVLDGYPRGIGFDIALRTLSPQVILCDELGGQEDCVCVAQAARGGVAVAASAHAEDMEDLMARPALRECVLSGAFDIVGFLHKSPRLGEIREIRRIQKA